MTVGQALRKARDILKAAGLRHPNFDAELIVQSILQRDRSHLIAEKQRILSPSQIDLFERWLGKRRRHYPIQYLRGVQEFYGREFRVTPDVLIPRPETEILVEEVLSYLAGLPQTRIEVAEVGIGSGCLGLSLLLEDSRLRLTAIDISAAALQIARLNASRFDCSDRVRWLQGDVLQPLSTVRPTFDVLVSNPPYGAEKDAESVDPGVRRWEPRQAVFAGQSGLEFYLRLFEQGRRVVTSRGALFVEIGAGQKKSVIEAAAQRGWRVIGLRRDLAGLDRVIGFKKCGAEPPYID